MKILVTGGTGFIGSHTVVELQNKGYEVIVVDNLANSYLYVLDSIEKITGIKPVFYQFDICDKIKVAELFKKHSDIAAVIHFAAYKAVGESVEQPLKYYHNNLQSLINLLETGTRNLVFSSSCTVYGQPDELPVSESAPIKPALSPYGFTKQICENIIHDFGKSDNSLNAINLRYFNPIGAHSSALIGELPIGVPNNLIPYITQTAVGIRKCLSVFGSDYNTPDGTAIRDYIHVVDLAKAHVVAVERLLGKANKKQIETFNLGTGIGYTVLEAINSFEKVSGEKLNYQIVGRRAGDVEKVWGDTQLANNELGWKAELSLDDMMLTVWKWQLELQKRSQKDS
ncbi:MAG: UDP-glucose 4-epimerase GalE [Bacteroidota bacterium]